MRWFEVEEDVTTGGNRWLMAAEILLWLVWSFSLLAYYAVQASEPATGPQVASSHQIIGLGGLFFLVLVPVFVGYQRFVHWSWVGIRAVEPPAQLLILSSVPVWLIAQMVLKSHAVTVAYIPILIGMVLVVRRLGDLEHEKAKKAVESIHDGD